MTVYVIMYYYFDDTDICDVFSTKEKAENALATVYPDAGGMYVIVERELDKII